MDKKGLVDETVKTQVDSLLENLSEESEPETSERNEDEAIVKL